MKKYLNKTLQYIRYNLKHYHIHGNLQDKAGMQFQINNILSHMPYKILKNCN